MNSLRKRLPAVLLALSLIAAACGGSDAVDEAIDSVQPTAIAETVDEEPEASEPAAASGVDELTVVSWGGAYQVSQENAYTIPYTERTGTNFIWDEGSGEAVARIRAMQEADNVTWDVIDVVGQDGIRMCDEGLVEEIDFDNDLPLGDDGSLPSEDFGSFLISDCFVPTIVYSTTLGYRTDLVGDTAPTDICSLFDTEKYPGTRAIESRPVNNLEWALLCDGVAKDNIYDVLATQEGQDQAIAKLDTIKDDLIFWNAGADTPQLLADGEIVMGTAYNGRLFNAIEVEDQPIAIVWDAQMYDFDGWVIPAGLPEDRRQAALDFVAFSSDTQRLADQAKWISYGPARQSSNPLIGQHADLGIDMLPHMPTAPANAVNTFVTAYEFWADYRDDIDVTFQNWLAN